MKRSLDCHSKERSRRIVVAPVLGLLLAVAFAAGDGAGGRLGGGPSGGSGDGSGGGPSGDLGGGAVGRALAQAAGPDLALVDLVAAGVTSDPESFTFDGTLSARIMNIGEVGSGAAAPIVAFVDTDVDGRFDPGVDPVVGRAEVEPLGPAAEAVVEITVAGTGRFRDEPIHAVVDPDDTVGDARRSDNVRSAAEACTFLPPAGAFRPVVEWRWSGSSTLPDFDQVVMAPIVIDLDLDGIPEVVFSSFDRRDRDGRRAIVRAVRGDTGEELWASDPADGFLHGMAGLAAGDLDGDGRPEIVGVSQDGLHAIAFDAGGGVHWTSAELSLPISQAQPALADLDHDGRPEIIVSSVVLEHDGTECWAGPLGRGRNRYPPVPIVADLDGDGRPEIVAGHTAYRADGGVLWHRPDLADGFNAVADFDLDQRPEVVLVTEGRVSLLRGHDGATVWGPKYMPSPTSTNNGGPPVVADMDGDGRPEIGVAGGTHYVAFGADGTERWRARITDMTSNRTASSVFDFDGDGAAEVVMRDERNLWIFRGADGAVLWRMATPSATTVELPVIADVDADGNAEIVNVSNNFFVGGDTGVTVFGDADDHWVPTRPLWNQHSYHITNVADDGSIPRHETPGWAVANGYRINVAGGGRSDAAPDITAGGLGARTGADGVVLSARLGNAGALTTPSNLRVAFMRERPGDPALMLGVARVRDRLTPGQWTDVEITISDALEADDTIRVAADDDGPGVGASHECDEANNRHAARFEDLLATAGPTPSPERLLLPFTEK